MNHRVVWLSEVADELTRCYLFAEQAGWDAAAIGRAADAITALLARDGAAAGESREGANRILIEPPSTVHFKVNEDQQVVIVKAVRYHVPI